MWIASRRLRLYGRADLVEFHRPPGRRKPGELLAEVPLPVEYKNGRKRRWDNDEAQLCAQALCLEERLPDKGHIPYGYIFYIGSRRRVQVKFTTDLRNKTRATIAQALKVAALGTPPPPLTGKLAARCPNCSLLPLCLPDEVNLLRLKKGK